MTKNIRKMRRQFNIFGMRFQRWMARVMPAFMPAGLMPILPGTPKVTQMSEGQRQEFHRLVGIWTDMHKHEMA